MQNELRIFPIWDRSPNNYSRVSTLHVPSGVDSHSSNSKDSSMTTFDEIFGEETHERGEVVTAAQVAALLGVSGGGFLRIVGTGLTRLTEVRSMGIERGSQSWTSPAGSWCSSVRPDAVVFMPNRT